MPHIEAVREAVIRVEGLTKRYDRVVAVDAVDFEVTAGTTTALLGANGAGKTTILAMLLGLLVPTAGTISVLGQDMLRHRHRVLARMNFSSPYVDLPRRLTVAENLKIYALLYGLRNVRARILEITADLGIADLLDRPTRTLSAGQRTRVALAKALLNEPELLLLDEPTASLDPDSADWVRGYLARYQRRTGATLFLASHNMTEVERMCTDTIILRASKIVDRGTPRDLIARHGRRTLEEVFLDITRRGQGGAPGRVAAAQ
jgi:ABC-2 type transport system ATP-binding protein